MSAESFLAKAQIKFGDKFNYSKVNYINNKTKITIICPIHGEFQQFPDSHIKGKGCPKCHLDTIRKTTEQFIKEAKIIHGDKYNYSKTKYKSAFEKVIIICPVHGEFQQLASDHTNNKKGCKQCYLDSHNKGYNKFVKEAAIVHHKKYDYSLVNYVNNMSKISIICPDHGVFKQRPYCHIVKQQGCPSCPTIISKPHQEIIDYVKSKYPNEVKINDRATIPDIELDVYMPDLKLAIEYNGLFWHSYNHKETPSEKNRHKNKVDLCNKYNINLFQIWGHEWVLKKDLVKSMINGKLKLNKRIYARRCSIIEINSKDYKNFMEENHLQDSISSPVRYGLTFEDKLVCVIGFNKHSKYNWELGRFATLKFTNIVGGASKLFKKFINDYKPKSILSFANRNHSNGNMYEKLNFKLLGITKPGYHYYKDGQVFSRQQFQKHKLKNRLENFNPILSEADNMFMNKYRRFWDSGNLKFIFNN